MQSQKEKLLELFNDFGIIYSVNPNTYRLDVTTNDIVLEAREGNVEGYSGFQCVFTFNEDGSFKSVGVWQ